MLITKKTVYVLPGGEDDSHQIISPWPDKVLMPAVCAVCHIEGVAYVDPKAKENKPHYCHKHLQKNGGQKN